MIKCGIDAVEIKRLDEINPAIRTRFIHRVYTPLEQAQLQGNTEALAGVFAAKEAVSKALGTGIGTGIGKVHWQDIEIIHAYSGEPEVRLHGAANEVAAARHLSEWAVSITHDGGIAMAVAVARD